MSTPGPPGSGPPGSGAAPASGAVRPLRERKRERTRAALVAAAADLFERKGYEETTVAELAAAADIGTRTFFSYFASKEEILFPDSALRVRAVLDAVDARRPGDRPVDVLLRALDGVVEADSDLVSPLAGVRTRLMGTVPAVRARALQVTFDAQVEIARRLRAAYPDELDDVGAAALVGAFSGAVAGALLATLGDPTDDGGRGDEGGDEGGEVRARIRAAVEAVLRPPAVVRPAVVRSSSAGAEPPGVEPLVPGGGEH